MKKQITPADVFASYFRDIAKRTKKSAHPAMFRDAFRLSALNACREKYGAEPGAVGAAAFFLYRHLDPRKS